MKYSTRIIKESLEEKPHSLAETFEGAMRKRLAKIIREAEEVVDIDAEENIDKSEDGEEEFLDVEIDNDLTPVKTESRKRKIRRSK